MQRLLWVKIYLLKVTDLSPLLGAEEPFHLKCPLSPIYQTPSGHGPTGCS